MVQIDRDSKIPIYKQIYEDINLRIHHGEFAFGSLLPSESKLCTLYGVERATVRRALAMMADDGQIAKHHGIGASVLNTNGPIDTFRKKTLLFLLPRGHDDIDLVSEPFNAKLIRTIEHESSLKGYDLLYKSFTPNETADDLIQTCNPTGVFFTSFLPNDIYKQLHKKGIPVVLLNQSHPLYPSVSLDNKGGAKMVVEHLASLGHTKIGYIGALSEHQIQANRFGGYSDAMRDNELEINKSWLVKGDWSMESGKAAMSRLISGGDLPTALFVANDAMAIGAMMAAMDRGISIPQDMSIVGFDDIDQASYIRPSLTTVSFDYTAMARASCMLMFDMIEHENSALNINIYMPLLLMDRESTAKVRTASPDIGSGEHIQGRAGTHDAE